MVTDLKINRLAVHYIDAKEKKAVTANRVQDVRRMDTVVSSFLLRMVHEVWEAEEEGKVNATRFSETNPSARVVKKILSNIVDKKGDFLQHSIKLANLLAENTPTNASPGLLGVFRLIRNSDKTEYAAILKIEAKNEKIIKLKDKAITQMTVDMVKNLLLEKIQKGAIYRHPNKAGYDLKIVDKQSNMEPAKYFGEKFIGCEPRKSDEHQVRQLIPTLAQYAKNEHLTFFNEKVPDLLMAIENNNEDVTAKSLTKVLVNQKFFNNGFNPKNFEESISKCNLGTLDIPKNIFKLRPGADPHSRKLHIKFETGEYSGMELIGTLEVIKKIMSVDDAGFVTFNIRTDRNSFKNGWE